MRSVDALFFNLLIWLRVLVHGYWCIKALLLSSCEGISCTCYEREGWTGQKTSVLSLIVLLWFCELLMSDDTLV